MVGLPRIGSRSAIVVVCIMLSGVVCQADSADKLISVTLTASAENVSATVSGRILVTAQDGGILLEERNGTLHNLKPNDFEEIRSTSEPYAPLTADELASDLLEQLGPAFGIHQTEHFLLCTTASETFTEHCGELLEAVYQEYFAFLEDLQIPVVPPERLLPVILFRHQEQLRTHAAQQHPETSFDNIPGYYSSRFNRMYLSDVSGGSAERRSELLRWLRKHPRHTETIVHEAVHLLGYNSGLHTRQADNPLWFTEGLATFFEPASGRGRLLWSGPGRANAAHLRHLKSSRRRSGLPIPLPQLLQDDRPFLDAATVANAYASSWALVYSLLKRDRQTFTSLAQAMQQRPQLQEIGGPDELALFAQSCELPLEQLETRVVSTVRRLRTPSR